MEHNKRIMVRVPDALLKEFDTIAQEGQSSRSALVREAMAYYMQDRRRMDRVALMQRGYMEMAAINLNIASEAFLAEEEANYTIRHKASGV
jgi:CopG family transcriptional regulator/antitoxin EndoAI